MGARGGYHALTPAEVQRLRDARTGDDPDEEMIEAFHDLDEKLPKWAYHSLDKAWDNLHRALTIDNTPGGCLDPDEGHWPLCLMVMGGDQLYFGEDDHLYLIEPDLVALLVPALMRIDRAWLRARFFQIDPRAAQYAVTAEEFEYLWSNFRHVPHFFARAAAEGRAVVFHASL